MPFLTVGFLESVDPAGAFNALTALADQHVTVTGDDVRVPLLNNIVAVAAGVESAAAHRARLVSPSLRRKTNFFISPLNTAAAASVEPASPQAVVDIRRQPIPLIVGENLNAEVLSDPVAAQVQWCFVWLADGPIVPVSGPIFTIRAISTTALVARVWSNVGIAFDEDLPRGRYQVVGLRPESASMLAARLVFVGGGPRPGALGTDVPADLQSMLFRYGELGVWGEFEDIEPPTVDCVADLADATQQFYFDLIQVREGPA